MKTKSIIITILISLTLVLGLTVAYALYGDTLSGGSNIIDLGQISMKYYEPTTSYNIGNALPIDDSLMLDSENYFEFDILTHATTDNNDTTGLTIPYEINIITEAPEFDS